MCTVSFIYKGHQDFVLTSNRDESPIRETLFPMEYEISETKMIYPKDSLAGGTWIGISEKKRVVCLLNGGFKKHKRLPSYRHSRGVVVKDFLATNVLETTLETYNLDEIEPFTLVMVDWNEGLKLFELVWDGNQKHIQQLPLEAHIWSSSTLYTDQMKQLRRDWFADFQETEKLTATSVLYFHKNAGIGDSNVDTIMNRDVVQTVSVTQVEKTNEEITMQYDNILNNTTHSTTFKKTETVHG